MLETLVDRLRAARAPRAGWAYRVGEPSRVEPTVHALLALAAAGVAPPADALGWLAAAQRPDGSWGGDDSAEAPWVTAPAVLALATLDRAPDARRRGASWLLGARSEALLPRGDAILSTDTRLVGWPWTAGTLGWVEPTAHALIALRATSLRHPRLDEARRLLHDRRCSDGGWNYGVVRVLGAAVPPYPHTTALGLIALATPATVRILDRDLAVLAGFLDSPLGAFDLAWIALALDACDQDPAPALARLGAALRDPAVWQENLHAVAVAALAAALPRGTNPFRLPA